MQELSETQIEALTLVQLEQKLAMIRSTTKLLHEEFMIEVS